MSDENKPIEEVKEGHMLPPVPELTAEEKELDAKVIQVDNVIDFENLKEGSVVVLKVGGDMVHKQMVHQAFARFVSKRIEKIKDKKMTILFLDPGDDLDVLTEEDMNKAGWTRKDKSLIINPFQ